MADSRVPAGKVTRRNAEARREQNRQASRNYRQKRKDKLALLSQLLGTGEEPSSAQPTSAASASTAHVEAPSSASKSVDPRLVSGYPPLPPPQLDAVSTTEDDGAILPDGSGGQAVPDFSSQHLTLPSRPVHDIQRSYLSTDISGLVFPSEGVSSGIQDTRIVAPTMDTLPLASTQIEHASTSDTEVANALTAARNLNTIQKRLLIQQLQGETEDAAEVDENFTSSTPFPPAFSTGTTYNWVSSSRRGYSTSTSNSNSLSASGGDGSNGSSSNKPSPSSTRMQFEARRFARFVDRYITHAASPLQLARIYVTEASFYGALFANCYALGMRDVEPLMADEGVSVFSVGQDSGHDPAQLALVRPRFEHVTPDLRPTDMQLVVGHHPYLDLIPFRDFRNNILAAIAKDPLEVDEEDLCRDLTVGGLLCWGSQHNFMGMEAGVPWDARSWEPQVWFLKKYDKYVGGWDGEMWTAVKYWRDLRRA